MNDLEQTAYLPVYGDDAVAMGNATCLRAPPAPDSPMMNRVVGLGVDDELDEASVDEALAAMGDTTFYVAVSPDADPRLDAFLADRGLEPGWGWMLFERAASPPSVSTSLTVVDVDPGSAAAWAQVVLEAYGLPAACAPMIEAVPSTAGWHAFLAPSGRRARCGRGGLDRRAERVLRLRRDTCRASRQGRPGALFAARIERARFEAGCTRLVTGNGRAARRPPRKRSYRNILRYGFEEQFVVAHRLRRRVTRSAKIAVDRRVRPQVVERRVLERERVRGLEHHRRRDACLERLLPPPRAEAPAIARTRPPKPNSGRGVERSFPTEALNTRNSSVMTAHTACTPTSSPPVRQRPSRQNPVSGANAHGSSGSPRTFRPVTSRTVRRRLAPSR